MMAYIVFDDFLKIFDHFLEILQTEGHTNVAKHFPKISEDCWRFPNIAEDFQVKLWPNGDASWRKLKTWVNLHASRRKFSTVWPPNPSQSKLSTVH